MLQTSVSPVIFITTGKTPRENNSKRCLQKLLALFYYKDSRRQLLVSLSVSPNQREIEKVGRMAQLKGLPSKSGDLGPIS